MSARLWAPGRVNLIGEHTDYSGGLVLPVAAQLGITVTFERADNIAIVGPGSERHVEAVAAELAELGRPDVGLHGTISADLPQGAGLGSSGALEIAVALALCAVADFELEPFELVLACSRAEHRAAGVPSGILDQAASLLARAGHALLLDCGTLEHRWVALPQELAILVVDSGERHTLEASGYAQRRRELEDGDPRRVRHVATENERVRAAVDALERHDLTALGPLFAESQASLRDDYEVSTPALDRLVDAALAAGAIGARLTGGGFGGSIVAIVERDDAARVLDEILRRGGAQGWVVSSADGALRRRTDFPPGRA